MCIGGLIFKLIIVSQLIYNNSSFRVPTPVSVIISAAVFALAHLTPGEFPQLFVLGNI